MPRLATLEDAADLAAVINAAFIVEAFFKIGDRTSAAEIASLMRSGGEFLVIDEDDARIPVACLYLECRGGRGYFGMLSIDPARQRQGLGRRLIGAAESRARERGCRHMDIHIVNLRQDLPDYYRQLGYGETGTLPFSDPDRASRPCFFIVMSKLL
jgi:GNAT superfamily N-acetyltransferase